jgi:hypothetical protein
MIDRRLEFIRQKAAASPSKVAKYDFFYVVLIIYLCRAFNAILKEDHSKFSNEDDHVIADTIVDEWQQRVDDVVGGSNTV